MVHPFTKEPLESDGKPVTIDLLGFGCDIGLAKGKEIDKRRTNGEEIDNDQQGREILAAITVGWSNVGLGSKAELQFSHENALKLHSDPNSEWIVEQVLPFASDRRNYLKGLSVA